MNNTAHRGSISPNVRYFFADPASGLYVFTGFSYRMQWLNPVSFDRSFPFFVVGGEIFILFGNQAVHRIPADFIDKTEINNTAVLNHINIPYHIRTVNSCFGVLNSMKNRERYEIAP